MGNDAIPKTELHDSLKNRPISWLQDVAHDVMYMTDEDRMELIMFERVLKKWNVIAQMYEMWGEIER